MPTLDVTGAPERLLTYKNILRSHCLMYVSRAIRNGEPPLNWAGLTTAWDCWQHNAGDKRDSRDVPRGFPAFLGTKRGNTDGDVIISRGDGTFAATDHPWGSVGICTLAERETETGRKFVGWAGELFGYTLTSTTTAGVGTPITEDVPAPPKITKQRDETMPYICHRVDGAVTTCAIYDLTHWETRNDSTPEGAQWIHDMTQLYGPSHLVDNDTWNRRADTDVANRNPFPRGTQTAVTLTDAQLKAIAAQITVPAGTTGPTAAEIANAVKANLPTKITGTLS